VTGRDDRPARVPGGAEGPRPRNYLAAVDRRRLFWSVMPVAAGLLLGLGWIERTWFSPPAAPGPVDVDTRLATVAGSPPGGGALVIESESVPIDAAPAAVLSAPRESLERVRDATFFRAAEEEAWFQTWKSLRQAGLPELRRAAPRQVAFRELFGQPRSFRGRLVAMRGTLHRLEELVAPPNSSAIDRYWQGWLEPEGGPSAPVVIQCLRLPAGMPSGMSIDEPVEVIGYFFKNYAYAASDTIRVAPVIMTAEPIRRPRPTVPGAVGIGSTLITTLLAVTLLSLIAVSWVGTRPPRRTPATAVPADLDTMASTGELSPTCAVGREREDRA